MDVECTGRQVTVTKALRALADEGLERIATILGKVASAKVILTAEKYRQIAEVTVKTRACSLVAVCESSVSMESALRDALAKTEAQALRHKNKLRTQKRQPKEEKMLEEPLLVRTHSNGASPNSGKAGNGSPAKDRSARSKLPTPVTVHSFPARIPITEPHIVRSAESVALRPMTLEEAVKEAEFRNREVFVFRDIQGNVKVLHRKRDGKMELIEAP